MNPSIAIIGIGRLGGALAIALDRAGYEIGNLVSKDLEKASSIAAELSSKPTLEKDLSKLNAGIIFIATQDGKIPEIEKELARRLDGSHVVFHSSGALSSEIFASLREKRVKAGSLHPLISISDPILGASRFQDAYFCLEGDPEAIKKGEEIVSALKGKSFSINAAQKALYHASAVMACGHLVALLSSSIELLEKCGIDQKKAHEILMPLVKSTVDNLGTQSPQEALTGTFARADLATMKLHIDSLKDTGDLLDIYMLLGERSLKLARLKGIDEKGIGEMRKIMGLIKKTEAS